MKRYKGYLLDIDGTLIRGRKVIAGANAFLEMLARDKIPFLYLTNNSSRKPEKLVEYLHQFSFPVSIEQIYTTSMAITRYLRIEWPAASVYVIGEVGLIDAVEKAGCQITTRNPDLVIVGRDRNFTYEKMSIACHAIAQGAAFLGTSVDRAYPVDGYFLPGSGALIKAIETATRIKPTYIGKPERVMMKYALEYIGLDAEEVLMVGDNLETDIMVGQKMPIDTWLVLSGVTTEQMAGESSLSPTYQTASIQDGLSAFI